MALRTLYDIDCGLDLQKLTEVSRLVCDIAGVEQPANRPVTGTRTFDVESGIIATWVRNVRDTDLTECVPFDPRMVGQDVPKIVLGKGAGLDNIVEHLELLGRESTEEQRTELLQLVKSRSLEKGDTLDDEDFRQLVETVLG